jgi:transposase
LDGGVAVQLVRTRGAHAVQVAAAFGVATVTLWRWRKELDASGVQALASNKRDPKGPSRLTAEVVADIRTRRLGGASLRAITAAVGFSTNSVRRALRQLTPEPTPEPANPTAETPKADVPVLSEPADRSGGRAAARWGQLVAAPPVFVPAGRVPLAGLLLAMPGLEATGLLSCAATVFGALPNGFDGLDTMLVEGVLRTPAGEPRAEGASRVDPFERWAG